jgi:crossover junction endodeoxyribonuclease RuvC
VAVIRILGIDPGTQVVGFGCLEVEAAGAIGPRDAARAPLAMRASNVVRVAAEAAAVRPIECGVLRLGRRGTAVPDRLCELADQFRELVLRLRPQELALEEAFHGKSAQAALRIGEARGVVLAEARRAGLVVHQYPPARIKRCVTGRGDASKDVVADMTLRQLGASLPAGTPRDASDALAVALTRVEERRSPLQAPGLEGALAQD